MSLTGTVPFKLYRPLAFGASGSGVAATTLAGNLTLTMEMSSTSGSTLTATTGT